MVPGYCAAVQLDLGLPTVLAQPNIPANAANANAALPKRWHRPLGMACS